MPDGSTRPIPHHRILVNLFLLLIFSGLQPEVRAADYVIPPPRNPKPRELKSPDDLVRYAKIIIQRDREYAGRWTGLPGFGGVQGVKRVLLVATTNLDPWVLQAFEKAFAEYKVETTTIIQTGRTTPLRVEDAVLSTRGEETVFESAKGSWLEQAAREHDRILNFDGRGLSSLAADLGVGFGQYLPEDKKYALNVMRMPFYTRDQLGSSWVDYPEELFVAIGDKVWRKLKQAKKWVLTDEWGTHLEWTLDEKHWKDLPITRGLTRDDVPNSSYDHPNVRPVMNKDPDMKGVLVTRALTGYSMPEIRIYIEKAAVARVEGGGTAGERFRQVLERYKNIQFPGFTSPGVGNIEEVALGTHPKGRPDFGAFGAGFGEARKRSGTVHLGIGATRNAETRQVMMKGTSGLPRGNHRDFQLYFPTLVLDGEKLIDKGRLTVLDDPEIRKLAAKFGNPDELLSEEWIPPLSYGQETP